MSARESLGVDGFPTPAEELLDDDDFAVIAEDYLGRLCAKDGCPNVPTPGYLLCADCAAAGGNV